MAMCLVAFAWKAHPRWRLVLAGNRDEFHARPAAPLARWDDEPFLIGGRDLEAGGTWLAVGEISPKLIAAASIGTITCSDVR